MSTACIYDGLIRHCVKGLTELQKDNIHCSLFIYQDKLLIIEVCQVSQALLPLSESMMLSHDDFHSFLVPGKCFIGLDTPSHS